MVKPAEAPGLTRLRPWRFTETELPGSESRNKHSLAVMRDARSPRFSDSGDSVRRPTTVAVLGCGVPVGYKAMHHHLLAERSLHVAGAGSLLVPSLAEGELAT